MESATYISLSAQTSLRRKMDVIANNIANASTPAYKTERMLFAEFLTPEQGGEPLSFVRDFATSHDTSQGPITQTSNQLDVALQGNGYLKVQTPGGVRYTRNGHFALDAQRQLTNAQGEPVLDQGDRPITIPDNVPEIVIGKDGTVTTSQGEAGQLGLVKFDSEKNLVPAGGGLFVTEDTPQTVDGSVQVLQGMIEGSNVQPVVEMTRLMAVSRDYTAAQNMLDGEHERMKAAIDALGKTV
jgi:flagellar basal-body rod protein FlgF